MTAGIVLAGGVAVGVTTREGVSVLVRSAVPVGDAISAVGDPAGRASVGDVAGTVSTVQAVRISNRDRTLAPARRMFPRERLAFKIAESNKTISWPLDCQL